MSDKQVHSEDNLTLVDLTNGDNQVQLIHKMTEQRRKLINNQFD